MWKELHFHPLFAVAHVAPLIHAMLWVSFEKTRHTYWRLILGFIDLLLTSALTPDLYLPIFIFLFMVVASLLLSTNFLIDEFEQLSPKSLSKSLPRSFIIGSIKRTFVILFTSFIIFPLLPRPNVGLQANLGGSTQFGYTEKVQMNEWLKRGGDGGGSPVVRIFLNQQNENDIESWIPHGLLKTTILNLNEEESWEPGNPERIVNQKVHPNFSTRQEVPKNTLEVIREPIKSDRFPVPYNIGSVLAPRTRRFNHYHKNINGEWWAHHLKNQRTRYWISKEKYPFEISMPQLKGDNITDLPGKSHLKISEHFQRGSWKNSSKRIFKGKISTASKLNALRLFFINENFKSSIAAQEKLQNVHPLDDFFFSSKSGHCEFFAMTSSMLLRHSGVPTRMVAGFRISRAPVGGVITVRQGDAHAWLETFDAKRGWAPFDPTPRTYQEVSFLERFRDSYDLLSGYWYQYVVSYDQQNVIEQQAKSLRSREGSQAMAQKFKLISQYFQKNLFNALFLGILGILLLAVLIYFIYKVFFGFITNFAKSPYKVAPRIRNLIRLRLKIENQLSRYPKQSLELVPEIKDWFKDYQQLRFGTLSFKEEQFEDLIIRKHLIEKKLKDTKNIRAG